MKNKRQTKDFIRQVSLRKRTDNHEMSQHLCMGNIEKVFGVWYAANKISHMMDEGIVSFHFRYHCIGCEYILMKRYPTSTIACFYCKIQSTHEMESVDTCTSTGMIHWIQSPIHIIEKKGQWQMELSQFQSFNSYPTPQYEAGFWTAYKLRASRANLRYKALFCSKIDSLYDSTSTSEKEEIVHQEGRSTICPYSTWRQLGDSTQGIPLLYR